MTDLEKDKIHLCDSCLKSCVFPECLPESVDDIKFGTANGLDNIIKCVNHEPEV
jgi:hypothetical protein